MATATIAHFFRSAEEKLKARSNRPVMDVVAEIVKSVSKEDLGTLLLNVDEEKCKADQFTVACRVGFARYTDSWEAYMRDMLEGILIVEFDLDQ